LPSTDRFIVSDVDPSSTPDLGTVPITGTIRLPPAPRSLDALGRNHSLEAALAELVDNSIDAGAQHVLMRFVQRDGRLTQMVVVDDGHGMSESEIDIAMTIGGERTYRGSEIGRFGYGLKAASFSQADVFTVLSRQAGAPAVGRRWRLEGARRDFACDLVDPGYATTALDRDWQLPAGSSGTIVRWNDVKGFPMSASVTETQRFLQNSFARIRTHLGVIYHRVLARRAVHLYIDVEDVDEGLGQRIEIPPIDPFNYPRSGVPTWPKDLIVDVDGAATAVTCHIWPGRSILEEFRLDGDVLARQGLYVYYNDRLIQRGGWNGLQHNDKQLNLARMALDVTRDIPEVLSIKPEKNGIETGPRFAHLLRAARAADGTSFEEYVEGARDCLKQSNRRDRARKTRLPAGSGFDPLLRRVMNAEIPFNDDEPLSIRWAPLGGTEFFSIDREDSVLWLNKRYRAALSGGRAGSLNDLPVLKILLYLLFEEIFAGRNIGPRDRDNLDLWQELLTAAAEAEEAA
jgi:Histidine kinase-, DNA gyrase B-, and HSP90-like ATPase